MEQERNIVASATTSAFLSGLIYFLYPIRWLALLGLILIVADLRFGVMAAKYRGEKIRFSRAGRRTMNKVVDYTCWILLSAAINKAIVPYLDFPAVPALVLLVVFGFEINSCFTNYFASKGKNVRVDFFSVFKNKFDFIKIEEIKEEKDEQKD